MITRDEYMMGRDVRYPGSCTPEIEENAAKLLEAVNQLLEAAGRDLVLPTIDRQTLTIVASGFRPPQVNDVTSNHADHSKHLIGLAVDLRDGSEGRLFTRWCLEQARPGGLLGELDLYMERPQWTPTWVHLQIGPPGSGKRVYIPSSKPAQCGALPEEVEFI